MRHTLILTTLLSLSTVSAASCSNPVLYQPLTEQIAAKYGLPPMLLSALVKQESNFCATARSSANAQGLGQLIPSTAAYLGVSNPWNPTQNLDGAARYLREQYLTFKNWPKALAAYNAGPGNVMKYGGIPPFAETQTYVKRVMNNYANYLNQGTGQAAQTAFKPAPAPNNSNGYVALKLAPAQVTSGQVPSTPAALSTTRPAAASPSTPPSTQASRPSTPQTAATPPATQVAANLNVAAPMTVTSYTTRPVDAATNQAGNAAPTALPNLQFPGTLTVIRSNQSAAQTPAPASATTPAATAVTPQPEPFLSTISAKDKGSTQPNTSGLTIIRSKR